jgi:transposase
MFENDKQRLTMRDTELFQLALGLSSPWQVSSSEFNLEEKRLDIKIDFPRGSTFCCPECALADLKAYDTVEKTWRHLNFFQHEAYLTARVPRVDCPQCGVLLINQIPWARRDSGFTLLFEAMIMTLVKAMPVKTVASFVNEYDTRIWRILHHYVDQGREQVDHSKVTHVGVDETSSKRGHNYVSLFVDLKEAQILFATEGKDASTVKRFHQDLVAHKGDSDSVSEFCSDMSPAFIKGVTDCFPKAHLTFDKFHIMKIINEAVDEVRRQEQKERPELAKTRYIWLKNKNNLKKAQIETLEKLQVKKLNLKTSRAYHIRMNFQDFFTQPIETAESFLNKWYFWATHSRLQPIKEAAYTIKRHWNGVLRWLHSRINNGMLEGFNSLVQSAKTRARGYRTNRNLIAMIYLIGGKLNFGLPT